MQKRTLKRIVSLLLIVSPLWWTNGCYTTQQFAKLEEVKDEEVDVAAKGGQSYHFVKWSTDKLGGITGAVRQKNPNYAPYLEVPLTLPADSIKSISVERCDTGRTVLLVCGITYVAGGVILCIWGAFKGGILVSAPDKGLSRDGSLGGVRGRGRHDILGEVMLFL